MEDIFGSTGVWFLIGAILVWFMQAGFAMVETGFTRAKNAGKVDMDLLPKVKVEVVVSKVPVEEVVAAARKALYTGHIGDGKIFVYDVEDVVRIRTGESGYDALQDPDQT